MQKLTDASLGQIGGGEGLGPFANITDASAGFAAVANIVSKVIGVITIAAGIWFLFQFLIGGFNWITSGGDKAKLQSARDRLTNAFIGLIVVVAGWAVLALTGFFFHIDFLLNNPSSLLGQ